MADLVQLDYEGKSMGLTPMKLSKTTITRFFKVHEDGLHLKIVKNGKCKNVFKVDRLQIIVVAKKYIYVSQLFISRMPKMRAIPQLVSVPLNPIPIAEHFRRSHPPCEHIRRQHM